MFLLTFVVFTLTHRAEAAQGATYSVPHVVTKSGSKSAKVLLWLLQVQLNILWLVYGTDELVANYKHQSGFDALHFGEVFE